MKTIARILAPIIFALGLGSCAEISYKHCNFRGYNASILKNALGTHLRLEDKEDLFLYALDREGDGQYEKIELANLPKGHELFKYVEPDSLNAARDYIMEHGEDR